MVSLFGWTLARCLGTWWRWTWGGWKKSWRRTWHLYLGIPAGYRAEARTAVGLALACGGEILAATRRDADWKDRAGIDPCTATDRSNEVLVTNGLRRAFPSHDVIGEETASSQGVPAMQPGRPTWIVDPIDGTQNFVHGFPAACVSIGLAVDGAPKLGVVYDPHRDELFVAVHGAGAYLDGRRMRVPDTRLPLSSALVLTDPGYERADLDAVALPYRRLLAANTRAVRALGSSVLALCWVAAGRASAFVIGFADGDAPKIWDWCAAALVASEAGACLDMLDARRHPPGDSSRPPSRSPQPFDLNSKSILCCCDPHLARDFRQRVLT